MSPNSGAWEVWLPWWPLLEGSAEMTRAGEAGACWPEGLTIGCSWTPGAFLVTRGHLMVSPPEPGFAPGADRESLGCSWPKVWAL